MLTLDLSRWWTSTLLVKKKSDNTFRTEGLGGLFGKTKGDGFWCWGEGGGIGERFIKVRFSGDDTGILITQGKPSAYCK